MNRWTTDQIDRLQLYPLRRPLGWRLTFRSQNPGRVHQLYVNGRLADCTDMLDDRQFEVSADAAPQEFAIVAVVGEDRAVDFASELPSEISCPPWVYRPAVVRDVQHLPGDRLMVFHDGAGGEMGESPALTRELWPPAEAHWGWGRGALGRGGFGVGGDLAPGFGGGAFGLGPLGLGAKSLRDDLSLSHEGTHQIKLRVSAPQGQTSSAEETTFDAAPPPAPASALTATNYDPNQKTLTLQISPSA